MQASRMPFNELNQWKPLPKDQWLPDASATICQAIDPINLRRCATHLRWGNRHHCRECGIIVCGWHSIHRYKGHRICNACHKNLSSYLSIPIRLNDGGTIWNTSFDKNAIPFERGENDDMPQAIQNLLNSDVNANLQPIDSNHPDGLYIQAGGHSATYEISRNGTMMRKFEGAFHRTFLPGLFQSQIRLFILNSTQWKKITPYQLSDLIGKSH